MFEYDIDAMLAVQKLDEYDLSDALNLCARHNWRNTATIREWIGENAYAELNEALGELSDEELIIYLEERYGVSFEEVSYYWMYSDGPIQKQ